MSHEVPSTAGICVSIFAWIFHDFFSIYLAISYTSWWVSCSTLRRIVHQLIVLWSGLRVMESDCHHITSYHTGNMSIKFFASRSYNSKNEIFPTMRRVCGSMRCFSVGLYIYADWISSSSCESKRLLDMVDHVFISVVVISLWVWSSMIFFDVRGGLLISLRVFGAWTLVVTANILAAKRDLVDFMLYIIT